MKRVATAPRSNSHSSTNLALFGYNDSAVREVARTMWQLMPMMNQPRYRENGYRYCSGVSKEPTTSAVWHPDVTVPVARNTKSAVPAD